MPDRTGLDLWPEQAGRAPRAEEAALLATLARHSPYLAGLAQREPDALLAALEGRAETLVADTLAGLAATPPAAPRPRIAAALRAAKRRVALATGMSDIAGTWSLEQVTGVLSDLADGALGLATAHLRASTPAAPPFAVIAMGKLGARELNFSSDVDLILLWDEAAAPPYTGQEGGATALRLARALVALMSDRDADGMVFRVDLRLRPDPASTPLVVGFAASIAYYESQAQTWERAALIKARAAAGDAALGARFLDAIRPFVWRRSLDFSAIADLRAMKERVDRHRGTRSAGPGSAAELLGHDLKVGAGGIREIEFTAQAAQLVWGGREAALRVPSTRAALAAAAVAGHYTEADAAALDAAYVFLRRAEHRLQMVADRQTHALPETLDGLASFAAFFGAPSVDAFAADASGHLRRVRRVFEGLVPVAEAPESGLAAAARFRDGAALGATLDRWRSGGPRALRTARARELLHELESPLLTALAAAPDPDAALRRLDTFLHRLPAGVPILSMLRHNAALLDALARVFALSPRLADTLAETPAAIEGLLAREDGADAAPALAAAFAEGGDQGDALARAARLVRGVEFRIAAAELLGTRNADAAGIARSHLAEAVLRALARSVAAAHAARHGPVAAGAFAVVALGKLGGQEMMAGSDLDLLLIYDHAPDAPPSEGARPLAPAAYYARLAQALVTALTVPTRDGPLYHVDMRLRPSGRKGPVAVSLAAFAAYHRDEAWTWERLALTRARVVFATGEFRGAAEGAIGAALGRAREAASVRADTRAMRERLARDRPADGPWDVKLRAGGLVEVEFIAQSLMLTTPEARHPTTRTALARLAACGALTHEDAASLTDADRVWRTVQGFLRLTSGPRPAPPPAPAARQLAALLDAASPDRTGPLDGTDITARLDGIASGVRARFTQYVGEIDA